MMSGTSAMISMPAQMIQTNGQEARKIVVVSDDPHRPPDRWVDRPIALAGRAQGRGDGVGEQGAHGNGPTLVRVQGGELAVRAEAAVREIDGTKRVVDGCGGRPECSGAADEHNGQA